MLPYPGSPLATPSKPPPAPPAAFPPPLGSSSPPLSSPTSYRDHPPLTAAAAADASQRSRAHSSAGLFAARARASARSAAAASGSTTMGFGTPSGGGGAAPVEGSRYGSRPALRKATTGFFGGVEAVTTTTTTTTGYALHRPLWPVQHASERATTTTAPRPIFDKVPLASTTLDGSLPGTMWKGKFRQRVLAVSQRRDAKDRRRAHAGGAGARGNKDERARSSDPGRDAMRESVSESDAEAEAEHEEIFRRMIQKEHRKRAHTMARSYDAHVGGSDPAVWEADVRDAERDGFVDDDDDEEGTPVRPAPASAAQWQYRSARNKAFPVRGSHPVSSAEEQDAALAQVLLEQEEEEHARIEAYARAVLLGPLSSSPSPPPPPPPEEGEDGVAASMDTPGGALGVDMEGFTWEDGPLSDDEVGDVEMT